MPIEFRCVNCTKLLRTPDESAGKKAKCPECGTIVDVPASSSPQPTEATPPESSQLFGQTPEKPEKPDNSNPFSAMGEIGHAQDSDNPYASPRIASEFVQPKTGEAGKLVHNRVSFEEILSTSWSILMDNLGPIAIFGVVIVAIKAGLWVLNQTVGISANASGELAFIIAGQIFTVTVTVLSQTWLGIVSIKFAIGMVRDRQSNLNVLSQAGPYYLRALGLTCVMAAISFLLFGSMIGLPALIAWITTQKEEAVMIAVVVGAVIAIIPMLIIVLNFMLSLCFVVDRQAGVFESMGQSSRFMRGNKLTAFLTILVVHTLGGLFVLCSFCLGRIVFEPYSVMVIALMYLAITGQQFERPLK